MKIVSLSSIFFFLFSLSYAQKVTNCFNKENFDLALKYAKWKESTSKNGKVLLNGYEVQISNTEDIIFNKKGVTIIKVNKEKGIILLQAKQSSKMQRNGHESFCELVERAEISKNNFK